MSEEEFQTLTARRFHALHEQFIEAQKHDDWLAGIVAATVANFSMCKDHDKPALQPWDLVPWLEAPPEPEQTPEEMKEFIMAFRAAREKAKQS